MRSWRAQGSGARPARNSGLRARVKDGGGRWPGLAPGAIRLRLLSQRLSHRRNGGEQLRILTNSAVLSWPMLVTSPLAKRKAIGQPLALALLCEVRVQQTVMAGTQPRRTFELSRLLLRKQSHQREGQLKQVLPSQDPQGPLFLVCRPLTVLPCLRR